MGGYVWLWCQMATWLRGQMSTSPKGPAALPSKHDVEKHGQESVGNVALQEKVEYFKSKDEGKEKGEHATRHGGEYKLHELAKDAEGHQRPDSLKRCPRHVNEEEAITQNILDGKFSHVEEADVVV